MATIIAADIGGTKSHLGLYQVERGEPRLIRDRVYVTRDYPGLEAVIADFIGGQVVAAACFGVPGPVIDGVSHATNVAWDMREHAIAAALDGAAVRLLNDLEATAWGVRHLREADLLELQRGEPRPDATIAVIAAGTGLGEGALVAAPAGWCAIASEGGHADFAPIGNDQIALYDFLVREFGHVSYERVLSGPGLHNIYRFLLARAPESQPAWLAARMAAEDPSAVISETALAGTDARCVHALEMFAAIYGAEAANLALKFLAVGGVYVCGGIAPKILPFLEKGALMRAFLDKGRLRTTLERISVRVSLNPDTALIGAAHLAASMT